MSWTYPLARNREQKISPKFFRPKFFSWTSARDVRSEMPVFRERPPGLIQHVLTVLVFRSCALLLPRLPPLSRSLKLFHWASNFCLLQGSFGPFGPKVANRVRKWVPGPSRPRGPKSPKRSRKRVKIDYFSTILTLFRLRFGLFGRWGRDSLGTHFRTLFATFGPKGPNDPCSRARDSLPVFPGFGAPDRSFWPDVRRDSLPKTSSLG